MNSPKIAVCIGTFFMATIVLSDLSITRAGVIDPNLPIISYVNFQSAHPSNPLTISGQLRVPTTNAEEKVPAVVIVHGSAGVDSRGAFYSRALTDAGIATLEIDMWAARGWLGGVQACNSRLGPSSTGHDRDRSVLASGHGRRGGIRAQSG
jgi:hypothetical protein